ncbi:MAG: M48 family metallopeptidase [Elusimicrobiota bacterium]|nr:MAG: M48 family metallopeptidase [Elusimicrobiota bacterium]
MTSSIIGEVKDFLRGLKTDWPELFAPPPKPAAPPRPRRERPEGDLVRVFRERADHYAPILGVTYGRISVKDQRTLWGSCTPEGNLNFNWRLTLAPPEVLDYLVIHELAHRAQMNHSRRFWEVVEKACPDHKVHRRWLRKNGRALYEPKRP